jgi:glycosyl transferase family 25
MTTIIRVISLAAATERRAAFRDRARNASVDWTFLDALRELPEGLTYDEDEAIVAKGRPLQPAELGCYGSHWTVWQQFLKSDADRVIVLEDDVVVDWKYLAALAADDSAAKRFDYLRLFNHRPTIKRVICRGLLRPNDHVIELDGLAFGTQGYILGRKAALRLLSHCQQVRRTIDDEMDRSWDHGVPNLAIFPPPLIEEFVPSTIGNARSEPYTVPRQLRRRRLISRLNNGMQIRRQKLTGYGRYR